MKFSNTFLKTTLLTAFAGLVMAQAGKADTIVGLSGVINGAQDNVSTPWTGTETGSINLTTNLFSWDVSYNYSNTDIYGIPDMAHFHAGAPGVDGPIIIPLADTSMMTPVTPIPTSFMGSQMVTASQASAIAAGNWYFNLHTTVYPAGIIRGQLNATPEPASMLLMAGGLSVLGLAGARRLRKTAQK